MQQLEHGASPTALCVHIYTQPVILTKCNSHSVSEHHAMLLATTAVCGVDETMSREHATAEAWGFSNSFVCVNVHTCSQLSSLNETKKGIHITAVCGVDQCQVSRLIIIKR